jgi:hypothetical protein
VAIVEGNLTVFEPDVRYRKQGGLAIRLGRLLRELLDQVSEIEALRVVADDVEARRVDLHFVDNRRAAKHRAPRRLQDQPGDIDEIPLPAAPADMNAIGFEPERVGIERDTADRSGPVELFAELLLGNMANQRRRREKAKQTEHYEEDQQADHNTTCRTCVRDSAHGLQRGCQGSFIEACHARSWVMRRQARRDC